MAIVTGAVIFIILNTFFPLIQNATVGLPSLLQAVILVVIMTLLMTYVIMPAVTWLLRSWLSKKTLF
jgi:antibiotic biosynthesis monooxygenase (ABM) superfamily enzyme